MRSGIRTLRARVAPVLRRRARRSAEEVPEQGAVTGMVEEFSRRLVVGWLSMDPGDPPARVDLVLDDFVVASTVATADAAMSGADSVLRAGDSPESGSGDLVHAWQAPMVPGPPDDRRNSADGIRAFSFRIRGIWPYVRRDTRVSVRVQGRALPIHRHGTYLSPVRRGRHSLEDLQAKFDAGYLLDQMGQISLERGLDRPWQESVMRLHGRVAGILGGDFGLDVFLVYGTLLGAVREGGPIGHDADFDIAYLSRSRTGAHAAAEMQDVALALVHHGLEVDCHATALHIVDPADPEHRIDLFHLYFDEAGEIAFPFGVAGTSRFTLDDWRGLERDEFLGEDVWVPTAGETLVAHIYGEDWQQPKPGFNWNLARTRWAQDGHLSVEQQTRVHWASFYSHHDHFRSGSSFSDFVLQRADLPGRLVDVGCGDGRDSFALARHDRDVLGIDASSEAVGRAQESATELGLDDRVSFATCDIADSAALREHLTTFRSAAPDEALGFYMRFFLHAIPQEAQESLLVTIDALARPGDQVLAEFRTAGDEHAQKVHGRHYRRYQDAAALRDELAGRHRFDIDHFVEAQGLSPYGDEDPVLCRVVGTRRG